MKTLVAVLEMHDQACRLEHVKVIPYTQEAMEAFEAEGDEIMGIFGFQVSFYDVESYPDFSQMSEQRIYDWMIDNQHNEVDYEAQDH